MSKIQKPEHVFTPRSAAVNLEMYVSRRLLEAALRKGLRGSLHLVIHGESGTGKSWLYKKVFADDKVTYEVVNLATAPACGSIAAACAAILERQGKPTKTGYQETKEGELNAGVAKAKINHVGVYELGQKQPFEHLLERIRAKAGDGQAVLVLDNLEAITAKPELLDELANLIILCDDEQHAEYKVQVLIVGVPASLREYYYNTGNHESVANRLSELPGVQRLSASECDTLVERGFSTELRYGVDNIKATLEHVNWVTDRVPQKVHEYCLEVAYLAEPKRRVQATMLRDADLQWMQTSLYQSYSVIESHMNNRDTRTGRRNQTLYCLAICDGEQFRAAEVEALLRKEFPNSTRRVTLNIAQVLSDLANGPMALIKRSPKGDAYFFVQPSYRMTLRLMLRKDDEEKVYKLALSR